MLLPAAISHYHGNRFSASGQPPFVLIRISRRRPAAYISAAERIIVTTIATITTITTTAVMRCLLFVFLYTFSSLL